MTDEKLKIADATLAEFNEKGVKFTMDDIAKRVGMSKKTIYKLFNNKEKLLREVIDGGFDLIKESEAEVLGNEEWDTLEKLKRVLIVLPDRFRGIDWRQINGLEEVYPDLYKRIAGKIKSGWEPTLELIEQGIKENRIRKINITVFKIMVESSIQSFIGNRELINAGVGYEQALDDMIDILIDGIRVKE